MKCNVQECFKNAVTSHGVMITTHGYCAKHRCCYRCGLQVTNCRCKEGHLERPEYIEYLKFLIANHGKNTNTRKAKR